MKEIVEGLGRRENQCWWDVDDRVESKGTGDEKDQYGVVEDEGNGGGVGVKGRENQCCGDVEDRVEGKRTGGEKDQFGVGVKWVYKGREQQYGWDFIFSGEEEGQLVVEGQYIFFHYRGSVNFFHQLKNCLCMKWLYLLVIS